MYHHIHRAARVAVMNYPAGQEQLIRSWFGGRTHLVNNDKWHHAPSYFILTCCGEEMGRRFFFCYCFFSNISNAPIFLHRLLICNKTFCFTFTQLHTPMPQVPPDTNPTGVTMSQTLLRGTRAAALHRALSRSSSFSVCAASEQAHRLAASKLYGQ